MDKDTELNIHSLDNIKVNDISEIIFLDSYKDIKVPPKDELRDYYIIDILEKYAKLCRILHLDVSPETKQYAHDLYKTDGNMFEATYETLMEQYGR